MIPEKRKLFNAVYFPVSGNEVTFYCKSSIKRLRGWACLHAQTCRHLIGFYSLGGGCLLYTKTPQQGRQHLLQ
jgi:hypothetical protein